MAHLFLPLFHLQACIELAALAASRQACPFIIAVCGAKGVGKSTFARLLVNSLLNHCSNVGFLDTDCGQPELSPPGWCLSRQLAIVADICIMKLILSGSHLAFANC